MRTSNKTLWIVLAAGVVWFVAIAAGPRVVAQTDQVVSPTTVADQAHQPDGAPAEDVPPADDSAEATTQATDASTTPTVTSESASNATARLAKDPRTYDLWVLAPALVAIILAIFTRQVIPALVVGILVGAYMMLPCMPSSEPLTQSNSVIGGFRLAMETYVLGVIHDNPNAPKAMDRLMVIFFTLIIGFMVGVIGHNGGTRGLVHVVTGESNSQRRGALTAWFSGMVVFFDDYANAMIVGPTMRPVFDRLKLSRAKLSYIVDSTAAPVASLALIGTWVGAEIGFIQSGLDAVAAKGAPSFLLNASGEIPRGMDAFIASLPYRYYPILALFLVFLVCLTGRDFGPMKRAQRKAAGLLEDEAATAAGLAASDVPAYHVSASKEAPARWWLGLTPVLILVAVTLIVLVATGYGAEKTQALMGAAGANGATEWALMSWWEKVSTVVSNADPYRSILYGAVLSAIAAVLLTIVARAVSTIQSINAGIDGMCRMFPAVVILVLAWSLSQVMQDLKLADVAVIWLDKAQFDAHWFPLAVFASAAVISFATGTSWGTMGILCPAVVPIAASLAANVEPTEALTLFYASIGSVLSGAVFGDHCSPISDTTVLSAIASECTLEEHVWTQLPYALLAMIAAMGVGDVLSSAYNHPWYNGLGAGALLLLVFVFIVGRKSEPVPPAPPTPSYT